MKKSISVICVLLLAVCAGVGSEKDFSNKVINIGMIVSDLEKSVSFYKDVIGMVQVDRKSFDVDADFGKRSGLTDSLPIHVEVLKLGSGEGATEFKLMTFGERSKKQENEYIHSHTGIQYITIFVTELEPIIERIKKHNVKLLGETPIKLSENTSFVLVKDPDGTFVELIGPMKKS